MIYSSSAFCFGIWCGKNFTLVFLNVVNIALCLWGRHLTKLNIIISFYNILMHFSFSSASISLMRRRRRHMLQLVHMLSLRCADAIVARPQRRRQNEFSYFLIAEKKRKCFFICVCNAARQRDAATSFNTLHSLLLSWALRQAERECRREAGRAGDGRNCRPCPRAMSSHPFGLRNPFCLLRVASRFWGVHNKNACKNANVASGSWSAAGEGVEEKER